MKYKASERKARVVINLCKENNKTKILLFTMIIGSLFMAYGLFLNPTYNCDLLQNYQYPTAQKYSFNEYFVRRMAGGRGVAIVPYAIYRLLALAHIHYFSHQWVLQCINLLVLAVAAYLLLELYQEQCGKQIGLADFIALMICFVSPAFVEIFCFCGFEQPLAYVFTIVAIKMFLSKQNAKSYVFLLLAISVYQNYVVCFLIFGIVFLFIKKDNKSSLLNYVLLFFVAFLSAITNVLITKIFCLVMKIQEVKAVNTDYSLRSLINKTKQIFAEYLQALQSGYGYYKIGYVLISVFAVLLVTIFVLLRNREYCLTVKDIVLSGMLLVTPPSFLYVMDSPYYPLRVQVPLYVAISMIMVVQLFFLSKTDFVISRRVAYAIIGLLFIVTINRVQTGISDLLIMNKIEFYEVRQLADEIADYEQNTGNRVDTVKIWKEDNGIGKYDELYLNINVERQSASHHVLGTPWSDAELLSFVCGRIIEREDMTEDEFSRYFNDFNVEKMGQMRIGKMIHFEDNVLYWITV